MLAQLVQHASIRDRINCSAIVPNENSSLMDPSDIQLRQSPDSPDIETFALPEINEPDNPLTSAQPHRPLSYVISFKDDLFLYPEASDEGRSSRSIDYSPDEVGNGWHYIETAARAAPPLGSNPSTSSHLRSYPSLRNSNFSLARFSPAPRMAFRGSNFVGKIRKVPAVVVTCVSGSGNTIAVVEEKEYRVYNPGSMRNGVVRPKCVGRFEDNGGYRSGLDGRQSTYST